MILTVKYVGSHVALKTVKNMQEGSQFCGNTANKGLSSSKRVINPQVNNTFQTRTTHSKYLWFVTFYLLYNNNKHMARPSIEQQYIVRFIFCWQSEVHKIKIWIYCLSIKYNNFIPVIINIYTYSNFSSKTKDFINSKF